MKPNTYFLLLAIGSKSTNITRYSIDRNEESIFAGS